MIEKKYGLKCPKFVAEPEFFDYLEKVCKENVLKEYILDFYNHLKKEDGKRGKTISRETFGEPKKIFIEGQVFDYDFNKHLFANGEKIGRTDFFRYQFVNLVNEVSYFKEQRKNSAGYYDDKERVLRVDNNENIVKEIVKLKNESLKENYLSGELNLEQYNKYYFNSEDEKEIVKVETRKTMFHELTHVLSSKTFGNGIACELINKKFRSVLKDDINITHASSSKMFAYRPIKDAYYNGMIILNELLTELYANDTIEVFNFNKNRNNYSSELYTLGEINVNGKSYSYESAYIKLLSILKMLSFFKSPEQYLFNPELFEQDLFSNQTDREIDKEINNQICEHLFNMSKKNGNNIDKKSLKDIISNITNYEKFLIVLGELRTVMRQESYAQFNSLARLSQAILLNQYYGIVETKFNNLLSVKKTSENNETTIKSQKEIKQDKQEAIERLDKELVFAKYIKMWIIKNNIKVQTPGFNSRIVMLSDELSEYDFAKIEAKNNINIKTWDKYIKMLIKTAQQVKPKLLTNNDFLSKEYKSYLNEQELNKLK